MAWTIYRLSDGEVIVDGWPGEDHPSETGFDFDEATMGAVDAAADDLVLDVWDPISRTWSRSVEKLRAQRWEAAKAHFDARLAGGFEVPVIGLIQTDQASREAIRDLGDEAAERLADGDTGWTTSFKNTANERVEVTIPQILLVKRLMRAFGGECFTAKEAIFDALNAASSVEELEAIDVTAGYPGDPAP